MDSLREFSNRECLITGNCTRYSQSNACTISICHPEPAAAGEGPLRCWSCSSCAHIRQKILAGEPPHTMGAGEIFGIPRLRLGMTTRRYKLEITTDQTQRTPNICRDTHKRR